MLERRPAAQERVVHGHVPMVSKGVMPAKHRA